MAGQVRCLLRAVQISGSTAFLAMYLDDRFEESLAERNKVASVDGCCPCGNDFRVAFMNEGHDFSRAAIQSGW